MPRGLEQIPWLYDAMMRTQPRLDRWRCKLVESTDGRVLEVGFGTGLTLRHYPGHAQVIGLDPALNTLFRARKRSRVTPLVNASAETLPFAGAVSIALSPVWFSAAFPTRGWDWLNYAGY